MKMTARIKIRIWQCFSISLLPIGIITSFVGGDTVGSIVIIILAGMWLYLFFTLLSCKSCERNLLQGMIKVGLLRVYFVRFSLPKKCPYCGKWSERSGLNISDHKLS